MPLPLDSPRQMQTKGLYFQYSMALIIIAIASLAGYAFFDLWLSQEQKHDYVASALMRQILLVHELNDAAVSCLASEDPVPGASILDSAAGDWLASKDLLRLSYHKNSLSPEMNRFIQQIELETKELERACSAYRPTAAPIRNPAEMRQQIQLILNAIQPLQQTLIQTDIQNVIETQKNKALLHKQELSAFIVLLFILAGSGFFVFAPAVRHIRKAFDAVLHYQIDLTEANEGLQQLLMERGAVEKALRQSETRYRTLADTASDCIITVNDHFVIVYANLAAEAIFGYKAYELLGQSLITLMGTASREQYPRLFFQYIETGRKTQTWHCFEMTGCNCEGREFPIEVSLGEFTEDGRLFMTGVVRNISERKQAEQALRDSEQRFRDITYAAGEYIWEMDSWGRFTFLTARVESILGLPPQELIGRTPFEFMPPEEAERVSHWFLELASKGDSFRNIEYRVNSVHGREIWLMSSGGPVFDLYGKVIGYRGTGLDITEQKYANEKFRVLFEHSSDAHFIFDETGILDCNQTALEILEAQDARDLLSWRPATLSPKYQPDGVLSIEKAADMIAIARDQGFHRFEWVHSGLNGREFYVEETLTPVRIGSRSAMLSVWHDIDERRKAEEALRDSEARFRALAENVPGVIYQWYARKNGEKGYYYISPRCFDIFGVTPEALIQKWDLLEIHPEDVERFQTSIQESLTNQTDWSFEGRFILPSGEMRWCRGASKPVPANENEIIFDGIILDISAAKYAEAELQRRGEELRISEERLKLALMGAGQGLWDWDLATGHVFYDEQYAAILGYAYGELQENISTWEQSAHPEDRGEVMLHLWASQEPGNRSLFQMEYRAQTKNGDWRWILARGKVVTTDAEGSPLRMLGTIQDITERKTYEEALRIARAQESELRMRIQESLLQGHMPQDVQGAEIAAVSLPSQHMDGDFYDFLSHGPRCFDVVVGDVMGKGTTAALVGAATKNTFTRTLARLLARKGLLGGWPDFPEPAEIVQQVHAELSPRLIALEQFVTLIYARFDLDARILTYVNCGHPRAIHLQRHPSKCIFLEHANLPIGVIENECYQQTSILIEEGDIILFYSDGVTEACGEHGELFGEERLVDFMQANQDSSPSGLLQGLRDAVTHFALRGSINDDLTCVVVQVDHELKLSASKVFHLDTTSDLAELAAIRAFIRETCAWRNIEEDISSQLELALNEAAVNIMQHAYQGRSDGAISLDAVVSEDRIRFRLDHWGEPFLREEVAAPIFDGTSESGFGVYIIDSIMDAVEYVVDEAGKNTVYLEKRIS